MSLKSQTPVVPVAGTLAQLSALALGAGDVGAVAWCTDWAGGARLIAWNGTAWADDKFGTSSGGGGSSSYFASGTCNFGTGNTDATTTINAAWITSSSVIVVSAGGQTADHNAEETAIEQVQFMAEPPTTGSVVIRAHAPNGTTGQHRFALSCQEVFALDALITSGLLAEYKFDQGSGQDVLDSSGNNQTFVLGATGFDLTDDPAWVSGGGVDMVGGTYLSRNGLGQFYAGNQSLTMLFVSSIPAPDADFRLIFSQNPTQAGAGGYGTGIAFGKSGANNNLYLDFYNNTNYNAVPLTLAQSFLAVTYNSSSGEIKIYQNGTLLDTSTSSVAPNINPSSANMYMGAGSDIFWGYTRWGQIVHYAGFYNRVLSDSELTQMQAYCRNLVAPRGVVLP
jgi:hypothetical protein